jgi:phage-related protein
VFFARRLHSKKAILEESVMAWTVETLNDVVDEELDALPADMLARFYHIGRMIEEFGLERVREPHVKQIRGALWEMRMRGKDGISRALYVTAIGQRVVVVRVFIKKTQKTPNREIELALERAKDISS